MRLADLATFSSVVLKNIYSKFFIIVFFIDVKFLMLTVMIFNENSLKLTSIVLFFKKAQNKYGFEIC